MIKILIIEDDPLVTRMYQKFFTLEGFEVVLAENGLEGLDKARSINPALIFLDIMMPKMNGLQVLEVLKKEPATQAIPVIILSNLTGEQDAETALKMGAAKFIVKSEHEPEEIIKMAKELLPTDNS